jgi:hypothetical protein
MVGDVITTRALCERLPYSGAQVDEMVNGMSVMANFSQRRAPTSEALRKTIGPVQRLS